MRTPVLVTALTLSLISVVATTGGMGGQICKDVPAPTNQVIPPHHYVASTRIILGEDPK